MLGYLGRPCSFRPLSNVLESARPNSLPPILTQSPEVGATWFKPVSGKSRTLGQGVEWFSKGKYVVVPPAPGREWLNNLPVAEAPEELKQLVRTNHTHMDAGMDFLGPPMSEAIASSSKVPKPIYFLILRLMPKAERRDQRTAAALFNMVALKRSGRNNALNYCAWALRELVEKGAIEASGACKLLIKACKANDYLAKDGEEAVRATIMSGLGLKEKSRGKAFDSGKALSNQGREARTSSRNGKRLARVFTVQEAQQVLWVGKRRSENCHVAKY